ncbi:hypothetical protein Q75_00885 [Bacillus coahuilensis p1.1.43]|uniref:NETI motif-containing protein n=1 Tax=Bacillus coahuilensis p1.1.43 TaxID=1150625 RepID=A0A147KC75_9BACI|nr:NETI motif-containing protein [Bacillus coahuilensis]KUP09218.1 hypothetical protein Q75_00885 [Bacillus coahuilensis p1.1.43]
MSKKNFEVLPNETIDQCLDRMKKEGYIPVRRMEKPIFKEVLHNGLKDYEPISSKIIFEGRKISD